jgi:hypothetical protein
MIVTMIATATQAFTFVRHTALMASAITMQTIAIYTPTTEQMATAREQVQDYLLTVKRGRKHAATHRYISVETLRPTKKQLEDYTKKQLPQRRAEPSQLRCLMVFDTQSKQFVGSGCYVVTGKPSIGDVEKFETLSAEYVGQ